MTAGAGLIGLQAASSLMGGVAEDRSARAQAAALDENARLTETQGNVDALAAMRKMRMEDGAMLADAAAGGGMAMAGSVGDLLYANGVQRSLEAANIRASAASRASGMRAQASEARARGRAAIYGGVFRAGAGALMGIRDQHNQAKLDAAIGRQRVQQLGTIPVPRAKGWEYPTGADYGDIGF